MDIIEIIEDSTQDSTGSLKTTLMKTAALAVVFAGSFSIGYFVTRKLVDTGTELDTEFPA